MKTIILILLAIISLRINAQQFEFQCIMNTTNSGTAPSLIGGLYKPENITNYTSNTSAYFPVLIVYVQFADDPGPDVEWWPQNISGEPQPPSFLGDIIAEEKQTATNWWEAYDENTERLSDFWMETSRGTMHFVGKEVWVVIEQVSYYDNLTNGKAQAMEDVMTALQNNTSIDWLLYDRWKKDGSTFVYNEREGFS